MQEQDFCDSGKYDAHGFHRGFINAGARVTDGEALIRSVLANPADDGPRLIYAVWLEEHGGAEDAEFIRVQIELARLGFDGGLHTDEQGHLQHAPSNIAQLSERQLELWADGFGRPNLPATMANWSVYPVSTLGTQLRVRRGFVEQVTCQTDEFVSVAGPLFARQPVTDVRLADRILPYVRPAEPGSGSGFRWLVRRADFPGDSRFYALPQEIGDHLPNMGSVFFRTADDAEAALSQACVQFGLAAAWRTSESGSRP